MSAPGEMPPGMSRREMNRWVKEQAKLREEQMRVEMKIQRKIESDRKAKETLQGCAVLIVLIVGGVLLFGRGSKKESTAPRTGGGASTAEDSAKTRPITASAAAEPAVRETPTAPAAWYEGGTLHGATMKAWYATPYRDRLATCADIVSGYVKLEVGEGDALRLLYSDPPNYMRLKTLARKLEANISEAGRDRFEAVDGLKVSEIAAACWVLMLAEVRGELR